MDSCPWATLLTFDAGELMSNFGWITELSGELHSDDSPRWHLYPVEVIGKNPAYYLHAGRAGMEMGWAEVWRQSRVS